MNSSKLFFRIPIFITARGHTPEVYNQNKEALKFSYVFIKNQNMFDQTFIISDNKDMLQYALELGFKHVIHYPCKTDKDIKYLEYLATYQYGIDNNYRPDWIILLNINQLFKNTRLLVNAINAIDDKYDIITSYTEISNRSHFFVDESINNKDIEKHLLTTDYHRVKMADAAIYAIKSKFAFECMTYDDPAEHFWNGKIKFFENTALYTDIYSMKDIAKIYDAMNTINEVELLNV